MRSKTIPIAPTLDLDSFDRWVRSRVLTKAAERDQTGEFPLELFAEFHRQGWLQAAVPAELGGAALPTTELIWLARKLSYGSAGMACSWAAHLAAIQPMLYRAQEPLRRAIALDLISTPSLASFCFTEPGAGSDVSALQTKATRNSSGAYVINGRKCFITNASHARHYVVVAKADAGLTLFYVPRGAPGLATGKPLDKMGHRDSDTTEVYLDEVVVPAEHRIGAEGEGFKIAEASLQRSRTIFSAAALGVCDRAIDLAREQLGPRIRYGASLLAIPQVRGMLSQLETEQQAATYLTCAAAAEWDAGNPSMVPSSMAKLYSGQMAVRLVSNVLELFGGWGYARETEIERLYRDAKLYEIIEGPSFVQHAIIARERYARGQKSSAKKVAA